LCYGKSVNGTVKIVEEIENTTIKGDGREAAGKKEQQEKGKVYTT
jgi:hypothetical protein